VGVDPDGNLEENPYVHERVKSTIDRFQSDRLFDLVTMRMVAEHVTDPDATVASLACLMRSGGKVVVYTVDKRTPTAIAAKVVPFPLHHVFKKILWKTEEKDTFPVAYLMNSREELTRVFGRHGFRETYFARLDDCRVSGRFRALHYIELSLRRVFRALRIKYPEYCILSEFEKCVT
jgi:2-polyprenyl-3-methyl-5-hydroxy-6-metoxy-1,4-benzoquinol methylase